MSCGVRACEEPKSGNVTGLAMSCRARAREVTP